MAAVLSVAALAAAADDLRLIEAVRIGDRQAVRSLLGERVDVNAAQGDGATALAWAVHRDDPPMAELLINAGGNVNAANDYGVTPLSLACTNRNSALVAILLDAGANPNAALSTGETPLMTCAKTGSVDAVTSLLAHRPDVNAENRRGQTALMWAAANKRPEIARLLIERGANVNASSRTLKGFTPPQYFTYGVPEFITDEPSAETHPDLMTSRGGFTPLMFAARAGDLETAGVLVAARANLNHASPDYGSALVVASLNGHELLAIFLAEQRADPNIADGWGFTALHYALRDGINAIGMARSRVPSDRQWLRSNMPALVIALLEHGANPNARVTKGLPPYDYLPYAREDNGQLPYLRQPGATPFLLAAASTDLPSMRALVAAGADPLAATDEGATPLMVAAGLGKLTRLSPEQEATALEAVRMTVALGADVDTALKDGRTALMGAAHLGANTIVEFLAERGANLNAKDKYGQTALGVAEGRSPGSGARGNRRYFRFSAGGGGESTAGPGVQKSTAELLLRLGATPLPARAPQRAGDAPTP